MAKKKRDPIAEAKALAAPPPLTKADVITAAERIASVAPKDVVLPILPENWAALPDDVKREWIEDGTVVFVPETPPVVPPWRGGTWKLHSASRPEWCADGRSADAGESLKHETARLTALYGPPPADLIAGTQRD